MNRHRGWPNRLGRIKSQHALTTQSIVINADGKTASATTYFTGAHFGRETRLGTVLTAYGAYVDELICLGEEGNEQPILPGASGKWLIKKRNVSFFARIGDEKIMDDR